MADELGYDALTLTVLADRLGVAVPSLYKHIASLEALRVGIAVLALRELGSAMQAAAARTSRERQPSALTAIADAYRGYAARRPGCYAATIRAAGPTHPALAEASALALTTAYAALAELGLEGADAVHAARAFRSSLHGFVALDAAGSFGLPHDIDQSFRRMIDVLEVGLASTSSSRSTTARDAR